MLNFRIVCLSAGLLLLVACDTSPLLQWTPTDVGALLQPISKSAVTDEREPFRQLYCQTTVNHLAAYPEYSDCDQYLHRLGDEPDTGAAFTFPSSFQNNLKVILIPGMYNDCFTGESSILADGVEHVSTYPNVTFEVIDEVKGRAPPDENALVIHNYLTNVTLSPGEKLILISYSKGVTDTLRMLENSTYQSSIDKVDAFLALAGVVNGTPLADDFSTDLEDLIDNIPLSDCPSSGDSGFRDVRRENQLYHMAEVTLPPSVEYFSIPAMARESNVSRVMRDAHKRLSLVDPRNDGIVVYYDAVIPGGTLLGYANADHLAIGSPIARNEEDLNWLQRQIMRWLMNKNDYPRVLMLESALRFIDSKL